MPVNRDAKLLIVGWRQSVCIVKSFVSRANICVPRPNVVGTRQLIKSNFSTLCKKLL